MQAAYCQIIDLIDSGKIDFRSIGLALMKAHPKVFITIHNHVSGANADPDNIDEMAYAIMLRPGDDKSGKTEAIKFVRERTGYGLKEAKDFCDALWDRGGPTGKANGNVASINTLKTLLDDLLSQDDSVIKTDDEGEFR